MQEIDLTAQTQLKDSADVVVRHPDIVDKTLQMYSNL